MRKSPFLIFSLIMLVLISGVLAFIQSAQFALFLKRGLVKYLPRDMGVSADFSELSIGIFPPSLSLKNPLIEVSQKNIADLPGGARVRADRLELRFLPFQAFAGDIRVSRLAVVNGEVFLPLDINKTPHNGSKHHGLGLSWGDLLTIRIDSFALENTRLQLDLKDPALSVSALAESASITQAEVTGGAGYELALKLQDVKSKLPKAWGLGDLQLDRVDGLATVSAKEFRLVGLEASGIGVKVKTSLQIKGDILKPTGLPMVGDLDLEGNLPVIAARLFPQWNPGGEFDGKLRFTGKVEAKVDRWSETLRAQGKLIAEEVRFRNWKADQVEVDGGLEHGFANGAKITVTQAKVKSADHPRVGGSQPASGGVLEIKPFEWTIGSSDPLSLDLTLDHAHLHWLGAAALKEVYPLDFRLGGQIQAKFQPARQTQPWSLDAQLNLQIPGFQLDNQKLGANRPLHPIIRVPQLGLQGGIHIDPELFRPENLLLSVKKTKLGVTGKIDFKTGYDLSAAGPVDFKEFESIANSPIKGEGSIALHVHGPTARVYIDFDTRLADAEYLGLHLGNMQGRITYDDDPSDLLFQKIEVEKGRTHYTVDGKISMGEPEALNLDVKIPKGRFEEVSDIFSKLTDGISWYPRGLVGDVSGGFKVTGLPDYAKMEIRADLTGNDWDYLGERFRDIHLKAGYVRGKYEIENWIARKQDAKIIGSISYDSNPGAGEFTQWSLLTRGLQVQSFDHIASLDFPTRGELEVRSEGKGRSGDIEAETHLALRQFSIRGRSFPDSELQIHSHQGRLTADGTAFGGQGTLGFVYDWKSGAPSHIHSELKGLDLTPALLLLNPRLGQDQNLVGRVSGKLDLNFASGTAQLASGSGQLSDYQLGKSGSAWSLVRPVDFTVNNGTFDSIRFSIRGGGQQSDLRLSGRGGAIEGQVSGAWNASILELFTPTIEQGSGAIGVDGRIGGTWKDPVVGGAATLDGATIKTSLLDSPFEGVAGVLRLNQNVVSVERLEADLANGRFTSNGTITLRADRVPELALNAQINSSRIKVFPFQFVKVRGKFRVHGKELPYLVEGAVVADSGLIKEKIMNAASSVGSKTAKYTPPPARRDLADLPKFKLDVEFKSDRGILVQNDLFDAELRTDLRLVNTIENPRPVGTAEILQGKLLFKDRVFQIQSGSARFDSPVGINPSFNMNAATEVNNTKIQLFASGRMSDYRIELSSNPTLPETEILSLLTIGASGEEARRRRSGAGSGLEQGEAASLLLHSLDFNRDVQSKTGFEIQIGEATDQQSATSVTRPRSDVDTNTSPKIVIRRNIGKNMALSVGSTVGVGNTSQKEVNLEYQVTPGVSVNGVWDSTEGTNARSANPYNYGVDLKLEKRFK